MTQINQEVLFKGIEKSICLQILGSTREGLLFCPPYLDFDSACEMYRREWLNSCFVGVGAHGDAVANILLGSDQAMNELRRWLPALSLDHKNPQMLAHVDGNSLVFLCGSLDDEAFWLVRNQILSLIPYLLITLRVAGRQPVSITPGANEGFVYLQSPHDLKSSAWLVQNVCSVLFEKSAAIADIKAAMAEASNTIFHYRGANTAKLRSFLVRNEGIFAKSERLFCCLSTCDSGDQRLEDFGFARSVVMETVGKNTNTFMAIDPVSQAGSEIEMILLCSRPIDL